MIYLCQVPLSTQEFICTNPRTDKIIKRDYILDPCSQWVYYQGGIRYVIPASAARRYLLSGEFQCFRPLKSLDKRDQTLYT